MQSDSLSEWLAHLERLHPREIDLQLDRVRRVLQKLELTAPPFAVISVGGTNGKGSCVAVLEAALLSAGYVAGAYTSPHLVLYNERVRISGSDATDAMLLDALREVEQVRSGEALTYFEFGTLAALVAFRNAGVDVAVLEVGMGGRLDAVNALEPLAAIVTSIDLDHQHWLGNDREAIGFEKAGIFRAGRPAIIGDPNPPESLVTAASECGAEVWRYGHEFSYERNAEGWLWRFGERTLRDLPELATTGEAQYRNASCAIAALQALQEQLPVAPAALRQGLAIAQPRGRFQVMPGRPEWIFDVAHNGASARELARNLAARPPVRQTRAVFGVLRDKPVDDMVLPLLHQVDIWYTVDTEGSRGSRATAVAEQLDGAGAADVRPLGSVQQACQALAGAAGADERVLVMGSFHVVGPALRWYELYSRRDAAEAGSKV